MKHLSIVIGLACLGMAACSNEELGGIEEPQELAHPVRLTTRAVDDANSQVGIYMVYGSMQASGNYLNNLSLTGDGAGTWSPEQTIYWMDNVSKADFIGYAPYQATVSNALAHEFSVQTNQSTTSAFDASDFLWGKLSGQDPTNKVLNLTLNHIFSQAVVKVAAGEGFTEEELKNGTLSVKLNGLRTKATVNLDNGNIVASGKAASIVPLTQRPLQYAAIIVPQQVENSGLVTVTWNGGNYTLTRGMNFVGGKRYTLTVTLKKTQGGINIGIGDWEDAGEDFGGTVN